MSVLVFVENWDGKFKKLTYEIVSYASKLAELLNTSAIALSVGSVENAELEKLGKYGAQKIISATNEKLKVLDNRVYTNVIADFARKEGAEVIILANNITGKALAPRLSVNLNAGIASGVAKLPISLDPFVVFRKVYSGNAFANVRIKSKIKILTLAQNSFVLIETENKASIEQQEIQVRDEIFATRLQEVQKQTGKIVLTDADIVISGGRGMKSPDNWPPLVELADLLGGALACSRPVSDEGWRPHEEHTGQTGKIIAPNLYFAFGISGSTQHIAGVSSSKYIVAVNIDKDAPIFLNAQYGIIGDACKILPKLIDAVKEIKGK
jgi:electron transfer flavoprotein alpha subunit